MHQNHMQTYVHGSMHHNMNYLEITNKMRPCIRIYYSDAPYCSTCFEQHISHHRELKNCICSLWFTYVCRCQRQRQTYVNQRMQIQFLSSWWWVMCHSKHV